MDQSFADEVAASLQAGMVLPDAFRLAFDWMEANGCVATSKSGGRYAVPFPPTLATRYCCAFHPDAASDMMRHWSGNPDPAVAARLSVIMRTGGDGSHAAIWLDDDGRQRFVHLGSGSGSIMVCVLADDPVDMLRLFAIGYDELAWPEEYAMTPDEVREEQGMEGEPVPIEPFRAFVAKTFNTTIPRTAAEIVQTTAEMLDETSDDPFWLWTKAISR